MKETDVRHRLEQLLNSRRVVYGRLIEGSDEEFYCDRDNFAQLYRRAVAIRRSQIVALGQDIYLRFLLKWHRLDNTSDNFLEIFRQYRGLRLPLFFFEREVLATRLSDFKREALLELRQLITEGKIILFFDPDSGSPEQYVSYMYRGEGWLTNHRGFDNSINNGSEIQIFLRENGASFLDDLEDGLQQTRNHLIKKLSDLTRAGVISCENYDTLLTFGKGDVSSNDRAGIRQRASRSIQMGTGRWFRLDTFGILGRKPIRSEIAVWQAKLLLRRHGILVKEFYRFEHGLLPWYEIFHALKVLEWQGEIRRGYFIKGLSGIQFALPEAVDILMKLPEERTSAPAYKLVNVLDPAIPFGGNLAWPFESSQKILRLPGNHIGFVGGKPVLYCERYFARWFILADMSGEEFEKVVKLTRNRQILPEPFRPKKKIKVESINGMPAAESPFAKHFMHAGYEKDGSYLVLWPSAL